jgi:hypothetical protein
MTPEQNLVGGLTHLLFVMFKHLGQLKTGRNLVGDANFLALNTDRMFEPNFLTHLVNRTDNKFVGP